MTYETIQRGETTFEILTRETPTGKEYWHEPCKKWFNAFIHWHGGRSQQSWLQHQCPGITRETLRHGAAMNTSPREAR